MKIELKTITPEDADLMLYNNTGNRPLSERHVKYLVKEIKSGRWKVNGDMIRVNPDGIIIDGQHRLHAIVLSKLAIQTYVMTGLPSDVFDTIDIGKKRSHSDTLACKSEKHTKRLGPALIMIDKYMNGKIDRKEAYSNMEIENLLYKYPDARNCIVHASRTRQLVPPCVLNSCYYIFSRIDKDLADVFVDKIINGTDLQIQDPWHTLRIKLEKDARNASKLPKAIVMMLCIKAWNYARKNVEKVKQYEVNLTADGKIMDFPIAK